MGSGMVPFKKALASSYKAPLHIFRKFYIAVFSGGCDSPILGKGGYRGSAMVPFERALVSSYKPSIHIIPLSALVCPKF